MIGMLSQITGEAFMVDTCQNVPKPHTLNACVPCAHHLSIKLSCLKLGEEVPRGREGARATQPGKQGPRSSGTASGHLSVVTADIRLPSCVQLKMTAVFPEASLKEGAPSQMRPRLLLGSRPGPSGGRCFPRAGGGTHPGPWGPAPTGAPARACSVCSVCSRRRVPAARSRCAGLCRSHGNDE